MKLRGNVEFVTVKESGLVHLLSNGRSLIVYGPIDDTEFLFFFEPEGRESDDLGRLFGANQNESSELMKHLPLLLGWVPSKGRLFVPYVTAE